jgi:hypothetical protein
VQIEEVEVFPCWQIGIADEVAIEVLVVDFECWNLDLCVGTRFEVHVLSRRKSNLVLLDEGSHVLVANNGTFPFLDTHNRVWHFDGKVTLYLSLTAKTITFLDLLTGEVTLLTVENLTAAFYNLTFALSA